MSGLTSLVIADFDPFTKEAIRFAFEREGVGVAAANSPAQVPGLISSAGGQVVLVGSGAYRSGRLGAIAEIGPKDSRVPVLYIGDGRDDSNEALQAGASCAVVQPAFLRDIVAVARLLAKPGETGVVFKGPLADFYGLYYLIRALAAMRWQGVVSLLRGLRRGELRLYEGEVTSAQVGGLHGLAALRHLLLWTDARIELRDELVVRRQQIPLSPEEQLRDAETFLAEMRAAAGRLALSGVYRQQAGRRDELPNELVPVLHLFDGSRSIADVLEDSPYRLLATLRIAARFAERGVILPVEALASDTFPDAREMEEWVVGRRGTAQSRPEPTADDWADLDPQPVKEDYLSYAAVVPSQAVGGEIRAPHGGPETQRALSALAARESPPEQPVPVFQPASRTEPGPAPPPAKLPALVSTTMSTEAQNPDSEAVSEVLAPEHQKHLDGDSGTGGARANAAEAPPRASGSSAAADAATPNGDAFTAEEEEFFRAGANLQASPMAPPESFDDLETGPPKTFWQRLVSRPDDLPASAGPERDGRAQAKKPAGR
jgi:hypothetical protein